ncbi:DOMON domain - like 10 [Theobroma cacao]|uniref:Cytochrome b561, DM13 and DOMON domain-containing protein At5g54830 n=2 Tax=Theobroma cacao TaxID=3641 RepID=A0AB32WLT4_THECC|nr:PREDICTED: cytochrome b561, DM13 and DOMON domain-containing protein At5g54830 [Theobroma cacao]EOY13431.1 DOMON domain-containing protein / dopamine beta-monooxygenase N-terminal domain-containing protein [Theobroma cacao]WRX29762.1 DOMON domain - like 10 [Theobroma cacao]
MYNSESFLPILLLLTNFLFFSNADSGRKCSNTSSLIGFESNFTMVQHQLRGHLKILDDCSFQVTRFDILSGSADVVFWGAVSLDFSNLTRGFPISDHRLNQTTYKNASFSLQLLSNLTWSQINVLSVWDRITNSDFGHVTLPLNGSDSEPVRVHTMLDNCKSLSDNYRVRWSLNVEENWIEIGLEAATGMMNYMAFGWANPNRTTELMSGADVAVAGFTEEGRPFVDDFYITTYSECMLNATDGSAIGVCPDVVYENSENDMLVNNTRLIYGHRRDGVSFVRFRKPLKSPDEKYDLPVNPTEEMTVIWALGLMKPPDSIRPNYLPQNHGGPRRVTYGHLVLNVSEKVDDCLGPLDADDKEDQDLIIADANVPLIVTAGEALHYPNPPNPTKVLYINKKEAPVLRVERGVPVKFSVQAGHDVALYITSDSLGGNATSRNATETIYAGGPEAEGVLASPFELVWAPDRNTPDQVYYQSLYQQKMGWRVQVVDGGLSDMYNSSVFLDDQQVTFFWTLSEDLISIAARGVKKSGYLAIGFGSGMVNSYAYVGWIDNIGKGRVNTYWIDGKDASNVHPTNENLTHVRCRSENGIITLEFTRPLKPSCSHNNGPECKNIVDPTTPLRVIWAMGAKWTDEHLSERNMHSVTSQRPVRVLLMRGSSEAEQDLRPVLTVHGYMMFLAWGILLPGGILAARYLKHVKGDGWYQIHVYLQYSGLAIVLLALLFAVVELRGFYVSSLHVKFGITAIFLACVQPVNAFLRPEKPANGEEVSSKRLLWEYFHVIVGRGAIVVGIAALYSGMKHLGERYGGENVHGLSWALIIWFMIGALMIIYLEYRERQRRRDRLIGRGNWVLGNVEEEEDSVDLLSPNRALTQKGSQNSGLMEVQLEPLSR